MIIRTHRELADFCRKLREDAGLTQQQLADALGESRLQSISNAENPNQPSRFAIRQRILSHFGKSISEVYLIE